jgi:hypothetical protein
MINETLILHTCGICEREFGLRDSLLLSDFAWEIQHSALPHLATTLKAPGRDVENVGNWSKYKVKLILFSVLYFSNIYFHFLFVYRYCCGSNFCSIVVVL